MHRRQLCYRKSWGLLTIGVGWIGATSPVPALGSTPQSTPSPCSRRSMPGRLSRFSIQSSMPSAGRPSPTPWCMSPHSTSVYLSEPIGYNTAIYTTPSILLHPSGYSHEQSLKSAGFVTLLRRYTPVHLRNYAISHTSVLEEELQQSSFHRVRYKWQGNRREKARML